MADEQPELSSIKSYLLRAHYEWMVDNGLTPHLLVNARRRGVVVPTDFVHDGSIVLNLAPRAVVGLVIGNEEIRCSARFNGVGMAMEVPISAVRGLVAREYGVGISFADADEAEGEGEASQDALRTGPRGVVAVEDHGGVSRPREPGRDGPGSDGPGDEGPGGDGDRPHGEGRDGPGRPALRVVK